MTEGISYRLVLASLLVLAIAARLFAQGETTSAIVGAVSDQTGAALPGATVTITNHETGLRRSAKTDDEGRFNFPQLKPGAYSVKVEAQGFELQENDNVFSGLGQKQTVDFTLKVAQSKQTVEVSGRAPLINPANPNTFTNLTAPALENLPNPGGDLTYPLQFAPGALINTAGNGNDFVGGTNGYGNVQFNGLPALSNGYKKPIVAGENDRLSGQAPSRSHPVPVCFPVPQYSGAEAASTPSPHAANPGAGVGGSLPTCSPRAPV